MPHGTDERGKPKGIDPAGQLRNKASGKKTENSLTSF
jgi:hypothetical protein